MYNFLKISFLIIIVSAFISCKERKAIAKADFVIGNGQMPSIAKGKSGAIHLVYGLGDSIMYTSSADNGQSFSLPSVIAVLPDLFSFAMRGPQITINKFGIIVTACTSTGNIFSYYKDKQKWKRGERINDVDNVAKEGLTALTADGENAFAIWLDLRGNKKNKIYGSSSNNGGKTWSKNLMIYTSPDTTVCECCKPSVAMKGKNVYVMFRNWLDGNRDLYLIQSSTSGASFGNAQKLGMGSWKLNGCPMDGGGLAVKQNGEVQTIWKREGKIFTAVPGIPEIAIGEGRNCTIETINNQSVYAWTEKENIIFIKSNGEKKILGKGSQPVLKALDENHLICIWENEKKIHASILEL